MQAAKAMLIARGVFVLVATLENQWQGAHTFYEKNGFTFTGRRIRRARDRPPSQLLQRWRVLLFGDAPWLKRIALVAINGPAFTEFAQRR